jgi:putative DNA primase/helicase
LTERAIDLWRYGQAYDSELLTEPRNDLDMAWSFLDALDPDGLFTFQTFDDSPQKRQALVKIIHAGARDFLTVADTLAALNGSGAGVFFCVNRTDGCGRRAENVVGVRAFFIDADGRPRPAQWHKRPDLLVWRDAVHWHAYWKADPHTPRETFAGIQRLLAQHYGTDPCITDLPRVMRLPGFLHRKATPTLVRYEAA